MDDLLTELGRQINAATEKILTPQEMENLKQDVRSTMHDAGNAVQGAVREASRAAREASDAFRSGYWNPPRGNMSSPQQWNTFSGGKAQPARKAAPRQTEKKSDSFRSFGASENKKKKNKWKKADPGGAGVIAVIALVVGLLTLGGGLEELAFFNLYSPIASAIEIGFSFLPSIAAFTVSGICFSHTRYLSRAQKYQKQLKDVDYAAIKDIAQFFSLPQDRVLRDIKRMMSEGLLRDCYLDEQETCLILSREVYDQYLALQENMRQKQLEAERLEKLQQENPEAAALEELKQTGESYIQKIREINIALPEPEISAKLDSLEKICSQIFEYVAKNPEKMPQIRKFMSYYLPTTLKLSEAYRDLELRSVETEEVLNTKQEIRTALDNINLAFQKLYANLMQKDLMGLSADISALETMLSQEGLIENDLNLG